MRAPRQPAAGMLRAPRLPAAAARPHVSRLARVCPPRRLRLPWTALSWVPGSDGSECAPQEELNELKEAIAQNDLVEVADALADLQYVLSGAVHEFGMGSVRPCAVWVVPSGWRLGGPCHMTRHRPRAARRSPSPHAQRFGALFDEVHRSNMSKACATRAEAERTVEHYAKQDQPARIEEVRAHPPPVHRRSIARAPSAPLPRRRRVSSSCTASPTAKCLRASTTRPLT